VDLNIRPYLFSVNGKYVEVVLTGRTAIRKGRRGKETVIHEIEAADKDIPFKEWVKIDQLFTVEEQT